MLVNSHVIARGSHKRRNVGQIIFALVIVILNVRKGFKKLSSIETIDTGIYFSDRSFSFSSVTLLDDLFKSSAASSTIAFGGSNGAAEAAPRSPA